MIAKVLGFNRRDLLDADWSELVEIWWPEALELMKMETRL